MIQPRPILTSIIVALALAGLWPAHAAETGSQAAKTPEKIQDDWALNYFGVNYSAPFAYSYRALGRAGVDVKKAIDVDVSHMARLGLNAYRVHIWDREIADRNGHVLENEHLDALDYLLFQLKNHDIRIILTPVAWWPPGYPEPDPVSDSFSDRFSREQMVTSPEAIGLLKTYVGELLAHHNPYTGQSYAADSNIIAIELFNEPKHRKASPAQSTFFINELVSAARHAAYTKPIFYNISEEGPDLEHGEAVCRADIQGVSFQWYPTGLTRGAVITSNVLPNVETYIDPFRAVPACADKMRMVYEFDAADVASSTVYPAMSSSLKEAGFRWATMFSYDPMHLAHANTEYFTHYLNLVYTPRKAIGLLIAAEIFRASEAERGSNPVTLDFDDNLAEYSSDTRFRHTSGTTTMPPNPDRLVSIAGIGSSPLVRYPGNGAYFLDRKGPGLWALELYPDIYPVTDPFGRVNLEKTVRSTVWREWQMSLALPDLGQSFFITATDGSIKPAGQAANGQFRVSPGTYLLSLEPEPGPLQARAFHAPPGRTGLSGVRHTAPGEALANRDLVIRAEVFSDTPPDEVMLFARRLGHRKFETFPMQTLEGFAFQAIVPANSPILGSGIIEYAITVGLGGKKRSYPADVEGSPVDWNYSGQVHWQTRIVDPRSPLTVFDPERDHGAILYPHTWGYGRYAVDIGEGLPQDGSALMLDFQALGPAGQALALRTQFDSGASSKRLDSASFRSLRANYRSSCSPPHRLELSLTTRDGAAYGVLLDASEQWHRLDIEIDSLAPVALALLPRAYPIFQPDFRPADTGLSGVPARFSAEQLDGLQFVVRTEKGEQAGPFRPCRAWIGPVQLH